MDDPASSSDIAFTPAVKTIQTRLGSRATYERLERNGGWQTRITPDLAAFVAEQISFFMATASTRWPLPISAATANTSRWAI